MLMFLGRASGGAEILVSLPGRGPLGDKVRCYHLRILRSLGGPVYRLGLAGCASAELRGFAVLEALRWLGVKRNDLVAALEHAVAEQTLRHHAFVAQGLALLGPESIASVEQRKEERMRPISIFTCASDYRVEASGSSKS